MLLICEAVHEILHCNHANAFCVGVGGAQLLHIELQHEISNNEACATSKDSDQPAHMCSLIRAFASCLNIL